jgi:glycosyltransferase involved in cell wall biosynthesis
MASISFVTTYRPIVCGIADYTEYITRASPAGEREVLSFNLEKYGMPVGCDRPSPTDHVWYGIPSRDDYSARDVLRGLRPRSDQVLWFQHEFGIWRDSRLFLDMLAGLPYPKMVSLHSLHFQSPETPYGLRRNEYNLLRALLPSTDAITVFSEGVRTAVSHAFPRYREKVHIVRHGVHLYPAYAKMCRMEAKAAMHSYLVNKSDLDEGNKAVLRSERVLLDPDTVVIGGAGFITHSKGIQTLFSACQLLRDALPEAKIAAVYAGRLREPDSRPDSRYASKLRSASGHPWDLFLETYLPPEILPLMLRALDVYFYWPNDCTQSGIMAHALGAGATIACRDMEGVGETARLAGGVTSSDFGTLVHRMKALVMNPGIRETLSARATAFADAFSWRTQATAHFDLADSLWRSRYYPRVVAPTPVAAIRAQGEPSLSR